MAKIDFAGWRTRSWDMSLPMLSDYKMSLHYPGFLFSSIFYFGLGTSAYYAGRAILNIGKRVMTYFKSVANASKYLNSKIANVRNEAYSAVIYGAGTKAGRIYAHFLAQKGFNLILVERDQHSLNNL